MRGILNIVIVLMLLLLISGIVFFATWQIPAPSSQIEKVLPDNRFPN